MPDPAVQIDNVSASLMHVHAANGAQRQADGAGHYAENLRYDYLFQKNRVSYADSMGVSPRRGIPAPARPRHRCTNSAPGKV